MDSCFIDVTVEFLCVAFHNILYYTSVYPRSIFETRRKYSMVVYHSTHPEVNQYIDLCLKSVAECLKNGQLSRVVFAVTDESHQPVMKFTFDLNKSDHFDETVDAYLVQCEQNLRAFCLSLSSLTSKFKELPEDSSFTIHLHTNESNAVALETNPDLEDFPLVEVKEQTQEAERIIPIRQFSIKNYNFDTYIEL
ncbi:mitotic spindle assembly checkpoint protein MAD2B [Plutella xylostella]|uniref:mitotic spindle assembly checkpoint protein MAD2B n=1 Tax=Plutella xylostella TaxID=51655 RepID=UPI0020327AFD|nr:mitotic spindle assembly checkpoint protein MAD2B [Plutella xylostella]